MGVDGTAAGNSERDKTLNLNNATAFSKHMRKIGLLKVFTGAAQRLELLHSEQLL